MKLGVIDQPAPPLTGFGLEMLSFFAGDVQDTADQLKHGRDSDSDSDSTHGCVVSQDKGFGHNVDAHVDFIVQARRPINR